MRHVTAVYYVYYIRTFGIGKVFFEEPPMPAPVAGGCIYPNECEWIAPIWSEFERAC